MKFRVSWWIHGAGRILRGIDIIQSKEELDENDVENLINEDLSRMRPEVVMKFTPNLPNFLKKHTDLSWEDKHTEISNWKVISVKKEAKPKERCDGRCTTTRTVRKP